MASGVDLAYAELEYPEEVGVFVGYMPREGPDLGPRLNGERRFKDWKAYLDACQERFGADHLREVSER